MNLRKEIKDKLEYILHTEQDEKLLHQLNEELTSYKSKLESAAWERTSDQEKQEIRQAFESMNKKENRISQAEMDNFLERWKEKLSTQQ